MNECVDVLVPEAAYGAGGVGYVCRDIQSADGDTGGIFIGRHSLDEGAPAGVGAVQKLNNSVDP